MAFPSISSSVAYHRPAGFKAVFCRPSGELYQTIGAISDGTLKFSEYRVTDQRGRNKSFAVEFTASCKMLQASLVELELLDTLALGTNAWLFQLTDAAAIPTGGAAATEGWVVLSAEQVGMKPKIVLSGDASNNTYIELQWRGSLKWSEMDAAVKASIDDDEFEATGGSGSIKAIGTYTSAKDGGNPTVTHILPAGVSSITLAEAGGATATVGAVKNFKCEFEFLSDADSEARRRYLCHAVRADVSYDWMETDAANLLNLDEFTNTEIDVVITTLGGVTVTLSNRVGISSEFESVGNFDRVRVIRFMHTGDMLKTDVDGVFS